MPVKNIAQTVVLKYLFNFCKGYALVQGIVDQISGVICFLVLIQECYFLFAYQQYVKERYFQGCAGGMDFSSSVRFRFGFEKNRGVRFRFLFGFVGFVKKPLVWFSFLCRSVVKYKKRVSWRAQLLSQYCTVLTVLSHDVD